MIKHFDIVLFKLINLNCSNAFLDFLMPKVTKLASGVPLVLVALILLLGKEKAKKRLGILILAGVTFSYYIVYYLKEWIAWPRPFLVLPEINVLALSGGYTFPSGRTSTAFMMAFLLSSYFKRYLLFYGLAALIGISRIYLGIHFPSDVFSGAVLGILIGYMLVHIAQAGDAA